MAGQALPQVGGAKSLYYKSFPLLSWEKGVRGMRSISNGNDFNHYLSWK